MTCALKHKICLIIGVSTLVGNFASLSAIDYFWDGTGTDWNDVNFWSTVSNAGVPNPGSPPDGDDVVVFHASGVAGAQNVNLNGNQSVLGIRTTNVNTFLTTLLGGSGGAQTLNLGTSGIDHRFGGLTIGSTTEGQQVNISLMGNQSWNSSAAGTNPAAIMVRNSVSTGVAGATILTLTGSNTGSTIFGDISDGVGTLSIEKTGSGRWTLRGNNTFTGGVTISQGTLSLNSTLSTTRALGTGPLVFNGGTIENQVSGGLTHQGAFDKIINKSFEYSSTGNLSLGETGVGAATIKLNDSVTITVTGSTRLTLAGHYIDGGNHVLTKEGTGALTLGATNSTATDSMGTLGGVNVNAGLLRFIQSGTSPDGHTLGATFVNAGATLSLASNNNNSSNAVTYTVSSLTGSGTITTFSDQTTGVVQRTLRVGLNDASSTFAGTITNPDDEDGFITLTKIGTGTQVLTGNNTYTGATNVTNGILQIGENGVGSVGAASTVTVNNAAASLAGTGTINGASVISNGFLRPGDSGGSLTGTITMAQLALNTNGAAILQIEGSDASSYDRIRITATDGLSLDGSINVTTSLLTGTSAFDTTFAIGNSFQLLDFTGNVSGSFLVGDLLRDGSGDNGSMFDLPDISSLSRLWDVSQFLTTGTITVVAVPEPSKTFLFLLGAWIIAQSRRRR